MSLIPALRKLEQTVWLRPYCQYTKFQASQNYIYSKTLPPTKINTKVKQNKIKHKT